MDAHLRFKASRAAATQYGSFAFALALACAGCQSISGDRSVRNSGVEAVANNASELPSIALDAALPVELAGLESSDWIEVPRQPFVKCDDNTVFWRHSELERLVNLAPAERPDLSPALASCRPIVATNAAIVMARWGAAPPVEKLFEAIHDTEMPQALRCAAAEALGLVRQPSAAAALRKALSQFSADKSGAVESLPELQAHLLRALARQSEPGDEKWFTLALRSPAWQVRYEALGGWAAIATKQDLPPAAVDLRTDRDPRVRAAALRAIAAHRAPHAIEYLQEALGDGTIDVQLAAIEALGELGSDDAGILLSKLKGHPFDLARAATVGAMAAAGMDAEVEAAAKDTSWQVRVAVAQTLAQAGHQSRKVAASTVVMAQNLARDANGDVQRQAIAALSTWPLEQAGPVLLLAVSEGGYLARKTAAAQLAARWPAAADFFADEPTERRTAAIAELKRLWSETHRAIDGAAVADDAEEQPLIAFSEERVEGVLERLSSKDVTERREAAAELAVRTATVQLGQLALNRLAELVESEQDPLVWRRVFSAIAGDSRDSAVRIADTAIGNASVEVRRGACEYLTAHGDPRHGAALLGVLQDPDRTVALAAVRALGATGSVNDPQPLLRMLDSPDKQLQLEAALSLSRLHADQGTLALERLCSDADVDLRVRAANAMGELADPTLLPALMTMLTDQTAVAHAAMTSLSQIAQTDVAAEDEATNLTDEAMVRRWQLWYREYQDQDHEKRRG
ncbi:MAG TPA: HEAT repeat domain-containing protein [Pirellulales bacterium]|jgi:HEAT repeat protein|nr:HEAT repeat domain-containing protein [Pirellulales bacterium]